MDNKYRLLAKESMEKAIKQDKYYSSWTTIIATYQHAIHWYLKIQITTDEDLRAIASAYKAISTMQFYSTRKNSLINTVNTLLKLENTADEDLRNLTGAYRSLAVTYFNEHKYDEARAHYIHAITTLLQLKNCTDIDFRRFTQLYLDLADTNMHLYDKEQAEVSINNAIKAFQCIQTKNEDEKRIETPTFNFERFHTYFIEQTTTAHYMNSNSFKNHEKIFIDIQEDKTLLESFGEICIDDQKQLQQTIETMLQSMTIETPNTKTLFTPLTSSKPSDTSYRNFASEFLKLTSRNLQKNLVEDSLKTNQQALDALEKIEYKNNNDLQNITLIREQNQFFKNKIFDAKQLAKTQNKPSNNQNNQPKTPSNSHTSYTFFGNIQQELSPAINPQKNNSTDIEMTF